MKDTVNRFSWEQFAFAVSMPPSDAWIARAGLEGVHSITRTSDQRWDLGLGWDGAAAMLSEPNPWPEGRALIERDALEQAARLVRMRPGKAWQWRSEGDAFDVGTMLQGSPDYWLSLEEDDRGTIPAAVHLVASISATWNTHAETLARRFQSIAAAILTLEAGGVPVTLWTVNHVGLKSKAPRDTYSYLVRVKDSGQPLSMQRLVCCAHPVYLRRLHFRILEQLQEVSIINALKSHYGYVANPSFELLSSFCGAGETVYLPSVFHNDINETATALSSLIEARLGIDSVDDAD